VKEPKKHEPYDSPYDESEENCVHDGEDWPCKKVRKWRKSKTYRIAELERSAEEAHRRIYDMDKSLGEMSETARRQSLMIDSMMLWLRDLGGDARMSVKSSVEMIDVSTAMGQNCVPGMTRFDVTYVSAAGKTYVNGELTEERNVQG
jgi:hypothetical protein